MVTKRQLSTSKWKKWSKCIDNRNAQTVGVNQEIKVVTRGQITEDNKKHNEVVKEVKVNEEIIMQTVTEVTEREGEVKVPETTPMVIKNILESVRKRKF